MPSTSSLGDAMPGIEAFSYYFPRYSIKAEEFAKTWGYFAARGVKEKTVASYDEDQVTMALEAASRLADEEVGYLAVATFDGPRISNTVATAIGLEASRKADFSHSTNASGEAFLSCIDYVESSGGKALLVSSDLPRAAPEDPVEHGLGAAAAALLISTDGSLHVEETSTYTKEEYGELFLDSKGSRRELGVVDLSAEVIQRVVNDLGHLKGGLKVACHEPDGRFPSRALGGLVRPSQIAGGVVELSGDTGCSSSLLALMESLAGAKEGDNLLLITYGGASSVVVSLRVDAKPQGPQSPRKALSTNRRYLRYVEYAQFRRFLSTKESEAEVSMGAYISIPSYLGSIEERYRLMASRCTSCKRLHFPPRHVCLSCGGREFDREPLSGKGEVYAHTIIGRGSSPTEFKEQQDLIGDYAVALVQLKEGPRIVSQLTDCDPEEVKIGLPVESVVRKIYRQEGVARYGYKFRPRVVE